MSLLKRMIGLKPVNPGLFRDGEKLEGCQSGAAIELTYLGTAGFIISSPERTIVLDPYLSRPGLVRTLFGRLTPDTDLLRRKFAHVDDVLVGHAHHDHILDAPDLCKQTGARLIGSRAVMMVGRAAGVPEEQLMETAGNEDIKSGPWVVRGLPSLHGKAFGRIPLPGDIEAPPPWPPRLRDLRHGQVLNWIVNAGGLTVAHIDTADFVNEELEHHRCDVLCLCVAGWKYRPNYVRDAVTRLKPRWVVPCHWDTMITPFGAEPDLIPGVDLPGFLHEVYMAGAMPLLMPMQGSVWLPRPTFPPAFPLPVAAKAPVPAVACTRTPGVVPVS